MDPTPGRAAAAFRSARTCYDHLAGRLGVEVTQALLDTGALVRTDGVADTGRRPGDRPSSRLPEHPYRLGPAAGEILTSLGVPADRLTGDAEAGARRPLLRFCVDRSERRHHLAGRLGADLLTAFVDAGWVTRREGRRAVELTPLGARELRLRLGDGGWAAYRPYAGP